MHAIHKNKVEIENFSGDHLDKYFSRCNHKLDEWKTVCAWVEKLPYFAKIVLNR
jgi:hypothetical protein